MKFYLSSFRIGDHGDKLAELADGGSLAYISNAIDNIPIEDQTETRKRNMQDLHNLGVSVKVLDLKDFFDRKADLENALSQFSGVWVTGGNTFILRQAMSLSGFDEIITNLQSSSFLYAGYSAGICVLAPDLRALQIVDDSNSLPYPQQTEVIWEGLGLIDRIILPHYKSEHPESADIDREVEFCKKNDIPYRTLKDGEVLFGNNMNILNRRIELEP